MKKIFEYANAYIREMNWKDLALLKICLCGVGILLGLATPKKSRKQVALAGIVLFVVTYVPLMTKFLTVVSQCPESD